MTCLKRVVSILALIAAVSASPSVPAPSCKTCMSPLAVCQKIAKSISSASSVYYPGSPQYLADISHFGNSSSQLATCSVEPGCPKDVGIVLQLVGQNRVPFAVKSGGHATNPGFSSTTGVQIAMSRFNNIIYDQHTQTVRVGTGLIWDDVYSTLDPLGVTVLGGRVSGIGVGGFMLGGGFSWKTNQHGLAIDNVVEYALVLPDGTPTQVTQQSNPGLFFALRGGGNNFGIVTEFVLKAYPQGLVWGGTLIIPWTSLGAIITATDKFIQTVDDPKAAIILAFAYDAVPLISVLLFYDAPNQPAGIFDDFLAQPTILADVSTRSYANLVGSFLNPISPNVIYSSFEVLDYTPTFLETIANQTASLGAALTPQTLSILTMSVQPFLPSFLDHTTSPSAYPPSRKQAFFPSNIFLSWVDPLADNTMQSAARQTATQLGSLVPGEDSLGFYPNYAIFDTPVSEIYVSNLPLLQHIKSQVDPHNVMGLAGGFKI